MLRRERGFPGNQRSDVRGVPALLDLRSVALEVDARAAGCISAAQSGGIWKTLKPIPDKGGKATALARGQLSMFLIKGHSRS